jgi:hypothetical protein
MTAADWRALRHLATYPADLLIGPGAFGNAMWGRRSRGSSNCSCPYARQAGKVLSRLQREGYAKWESFDRPKRWGWRITEAGREVLAIGARITRMFPEEKSP